MTKKFFDTFERSKYKIISLYINITLITALFSQIYRIILRRPFEYRSILMWGILIVPLIYFFLESNSKERIKVANYYCHCLACNNANNIFCSQPLYCSQN